MPRSMPAYSLIIQALCLMRMLLWLTSCGRSPELNAVAKLQIGLSTGIVEHTLEATGVAPDGRTRVYRTYRAISVRAAEHAYLRTKETLLPVEFDILPDLTKAAGEELGTVTDYSFAL